MTGLLFATTIAKAVLANALRYYIKNAKEREDRRFVWVPGSLVGFKMVRR